MFCHYVLFRGQDYYSEYYWWKCVGGYKVRTACAKFPSGVIERVPGSNTGLYIDGCLYDCTNGTLGATMESPCLTQDPEGSNPPMTYTRGGVVVTTRITTTTANPTIPIRRPPKTTPTTTSSTTARIFSRTFRITGPPQKTSKWI